MKLNKFWFLSCFMLQAAFPDFVAAQGYPTKNIRLIAPFYAAGAASQILAHLVAEKLTEAVGQPVVVDAKTGAGGNIGAEIAAKSPPDGYTLVILSGSHTTSPGMYKKLEYDVLKDFAPISLVATAPSVLVVHPSLPAKSLKELAQLARAHPGKLSFGSGGIGASNHLAGELFKSLAKVNLLHVPYKGASAALNYILAGEVDMVVVTVSAGIPFINAGKLRGLAVLAPDHVATLPGVPTTAEAGMPELVVIGWYGIAAPAGVRPEIIARLNGEIVRIMQMGDIKRRLANVGVDSASNTPAEFSHFVRAEVAKWARVIKEAKIEPE